MTTNHEHSGDNPEHPRIYHPQIWLASLADYTAGILHGQWADATNLTQLTDTINHLLATSQVPDAEEYAIFDYDDFAGFRVGENEMLEIVTTVAQGIAEYGAPYAAWAQLHDADPGMLASFTDAYLGTYDSPARWAEETLEDEGIPQIIADALPETLRSYVHLDYDAWAADADRSGAIHIEPLPDGHVAVFQIL